MMTPMKRPSKRRFGSSGIDPLEVGAIALLKRKYPVALRAFTTAYQSKDWRTRDLAVTGLGDMLDPRLPENGKPPAVALAIGWEPPTLMQSSKVFITDRRLLVLLETYTQPWRWQPKNIAEQKTLHALRAALTLLEQILLNDANHLVRFSTLMVLTDTIDESQQEFIRPVLQRALGREQNELLAEMLSDLLA
jgi:hypothetical protein